MTTLKSDNRIQNEPFAVKMSLDNLNLMHVRVSGGHPFE